MRLSLQEIGQYLGDQGAPDQEVLFYSIDSRDISESTLFFAIKGARVDGHSFLEEVSQKGGIAAVVDRRYNGSSFGLYLFYVEDVIASLQKLAQALLKRSKVPVIGITGSVGKTSTREALYHLLKQTFQVGRAEKNYNSQVTVPLVILRSSGIEDFLILEMGMTHKGQIGNLIDIAPPQYVIITKIGLMHVVNFEGIEGIAAAKSEILHPGVNFAVIHRSNLLFSPVREKLTAPYKAYPAATPRNNYIMPFEESHLNENVVGAITLAEHLGVSPREIERGLLEITPFDHRFQKKEIRGALFIDDAYNAGVDSFLMAMDNLPASGRKVGVIGSMKELGKLSEEMHKIVGGRAIEVFEELFFLGEEWAEIEKDLKNSGKKWLQCSSLDHLIQELQKSVKCGDVVFIKGSNSLGLHNLVSKFEEST